MVAVFFAGAAFVAPLVAEAAFFAGAAFVVVAAFLAGAPFFAPLVAEAAFFAGAAFVAGVAFFTGVVFVAVLPRPPTAFRAVSAALDPACLTADSARLATMSSHFPGVRRTPTARPVRRRIRPRPARLNAETRW